MFGMLERLVGLLQRLVNPVDGSSRKIEIAAVIF